MPNPSRDPDIDTAARRLGRQLRRIRLSAGYATQAALAARIGFGEDVISKGESGSRPPSEDVFPLVLDACTTSADGTRHILTDGERAAMTELWEIARREHATGVPAFFEQYWQAEDKAAFLHLWGLLLIPGPLQTREYARAMFAAGGLDKAEADEQADLRIARQAKADGPKAAHVTALIHELALNCMVGSPEIMVSQMEVPLGGVEAAQRDHPGRPR